jgi:murein DD-endopeptidase MepM/ murein hydrolase activator NlpD
VSGSAKHRKSSGRAPKPGSARHRKPSPIANALSNTPGQVAAVAAGAVLIGAAVTPAVAGLVNPNSHPASNPDPAAALRQPDASSGSDVVAGHRTGHDSGGNTASNPQQPASNLPAVKRHAQRIAAERHARKHRRHSAATVTVVYDNPLRAISGLRPERVDMGVDFGGTGPIYAVGDGVVTQATTSAGWPGGGWITYQLTDGPAAGEIVYVAEDVTPAVQVGQHVTPGTVVANMFAGSAGIETGWAMLDSASAESQLAEAGGISGGGPFPTMIGLNFDQMLVRLGVPAAPNAGESGFGVLPSRYPLNWATALAAR